MTIEHSQDYASASPTHASAGPHGTWGKRGDPAPQERLKALNRGRLGQNAGKQAERPSIPQQAEGGGADVNTRMAMHSEQTEARGVARRKLIRLLVERILSNGLCADTADASN